MVWVTIAGHDVKATGAEWLNLQIEVDFSPPWAPRESMVDVATLSAHFLPPKMVGVRQPLLISSLLGPPRRQG